MASALPSPLNTPPIGTPPIPSQQSQPTSTSAPAKTPVNLSPNSHLDPSAYVRGTHAIQIGANVLIHPRAHLVSIYSPLTIKDNTIIAEKSIIGGPIPPSTSTASTEQHPSQSPPTSSDQPTAIGSSVHIHPNVTINAGAKINDFTVLESNTTISHNVTIGKHSKICAGVTVCKDVPDWTVVYGSNNEQRRRRRKLPVSKAETAGDSASKVDDEEDVVEKARLQMMNTERDSTMAVLKRAAARNLSSRSKR